MKKETLIKLTKYFLDFMFFAGIITTITLPFSIKWLGNYMERLNDLYISLLVIYFVLGIAAVVIIYELRRIFKTVLNKNCFVRDNVESLKRMGNWSFFIVVMILVRCFFYLTIAAAVVILVFTIAGLFSKVLAFVFEEAVGYKEENDFTI